MTDNMDRWNRLSKTDPAATKKFKRTSFAGTAVNPLYLVKRMTEEFGSAGEGWGVKSADFQTVFPQDVDPLVYCTVTIWVGEVDKTVIGVGGDTLVMTFKSGGQTADDEAFKKAYTDALGNAFKQLGMAADIYLGLFDDNKYVQERTAEVEAQTNPHTALLDEVATEMSKAETINKLDAAIGKISNVKNELRSKYGGAYQSITSIYRTNRERIENG